jgi:transcriptional regulator with XRE-family HTH domain
MTESMHGYVLAELQKAKGHWRSVAEGSGVSRRTVEKIARGEIVDPGVSHIEKLACYFRDQATA